MIFKYRGLGSSRKNSRPLHKNACECAKIKSCRRRRKEGGKKVETKTKAYFKIRLYTDDAEVQRFSITTGNGRRCDMSVTVGLQYVQESFLCKVYPKIPFPLAHGV